MNTNNTQEPTSPGQRPAPTGLDIIHGILDGLRSLEARVAQVEQSLSNLTISGEAVNVLNVSALRTLEQVIHAAITPVIAPVAEAEAVQPIVEEVPVQEEAAAIEQVA